MVARVTGLLLLLLGFDLIATSSTVAGKSLPPAGSYLRNTTFGSAVYVSPPSYNHTLLGPIGNGGASWYLAQWDIVDALPLAPDYDQGDCFLQNVDWNIENSNARVCLSSANDMIELAQNGGDDLPCGNEFDLFISPTDGAYLNAPMNILPFDESPPLSNISGLSISFWAEYVYSEVTQRCGQAPQCGPSGQVDYGYVTIAVILSTGTQTLFYQVGLADTRTNCGENPCNSIHSWFSESDPFGVNDSIGLYDLPCLTVEGSPLTANINILPQLVQSISVEGPAKGMDGDLSHWRLGGLYAGGGLQGDVAQTVIFGDINLQYSA